MRLLLDTHVLLWWLEGDPRLSPKAIRLIGSPGNNVEVSLASLWEIFLKVRKGKLRLQDPPGTFLRSALARERMSILPISFDHIEETWRLPDIHNDPFDRLLVAQATVEGITLVTGDQHIRRYRVQTAW